MSIEHAYKKFNFSGLTKYYYSFFAGIIFLLSITTVWYIPLGLTLFGLTVVMVLDRLGKGIILRELIALYSLFICIFMPILGYLVYNESNALARIWVRYMLVSEQSYFSYALPAMTGFALVLCLPINSMTKSDQEWAIFNFLARAKRQLSQIPHISIFMIVAGVLFYFIAEYMPVSLQFFALLIFWSSFAGVLYLYYTPNIRHKGLFLLGFALFIFINATESGMFTILAYMGITMFSFFFIGRRMQFWKKLLALGVGILLLIVIQSVKQTFRRMTWKQEYEGNKVALFINLAKEKLTQSSALFSVDAFFPIYYRSNQGFNVSLVIRRFPSVQSYDNGANLARTLAASLIPRFLWPEKPEAGGKFNMKYYTGITLRGWSTNVGPLGEAYGSFGPTGGILFMTLLGAFIRWAYKKVFELAWKLPLLIFWLPVLFYQVTYSAESDTLQILNSLFKSAFFVWLLIKVFPHWFGLKKKIPGMDERTTRTTSTVY